MPDHPSSAADRLDELLLAWQQAYDRGEELTADALCADHPDLRAEVAAQVAVLKRVADLGKTRRPDAATRSGNVAGGRADAALPVGADVAGHVLLRELGRGGMGVVYLARQPGLGREVAVKVVLSGAFSAERDRARLRAEAEAIAKLRHPNVVQVFQVGEHAGQPFVVLEYCGHGTLADHTGTPWGPAAAARVVEALARAVHAAHAARVVHRDLKPGNVLLDGPFDPSKAATAADPLPLKVADFGLAKHLDDHGVTPTGAGVGTPAYMAPEQAHGGSDVGPAADVWALGAILYELLTGRPPFLGDTPVGTMLLVLGQAPVPPGRLAPSVSRDLEAVCLACLEKEPARRYATAADLADDLRRTLDGRPTRVRPLGPAGRAARWVRRHPTRSALGAAAVAVVLGLVVGGLAVWADRVQAAADLGVAQRQADLEKRAADAERFHAGLSRVRERRSGAAPGWSARNLDDIAALAPSPHAAGHLADLRSEAAAALAAVELRRTGDYVTGGRWYAAAFSPNGRTLAAASWVAVAHGEVRRVDAVTGADLPPLTFPLNPLDAVRDGQNGCRSIAFSPDGRWLVVGLKHGQLVRWNVDAGTPPVVWPGHYAEPESANSRQVTVLGFTADSRTLVSQTSTGPARTWDVAPDGDWRQLAVEGRVRVPEADAYDPAGVPAAVADAAGAWRPGTFHPRAGTVSWVAAGDAGGRQAVAPSGSVVFQSWAGPHGPALRAAAPDRWLQEFATPGRPEVTAARFTPDGGHVVTGEEFARRVTLWDVAGMRPAAAALVDDEVTQARSGGSVKFAVAPTGRDVAVCEATGVGRYERTGLARPTVGVVPSRWVQAVAVSADGRTIVVQSADPDGPARLHRWPAHDRPSPTPADEVPHGAPSFRRSLVAASADGADLAHLTAAADGKAVLVHSRLGVLPADEPSDLRIGPDGRVWLAESRAVRAIGPDGAARTVVSNDLLMREHGMAFKSVAPGARRAAAGRRDGTVFWATADGTLTGQARAFDSAVTALALTADEGSAVAGGERGELAFVPADGGAVRRVADAHADAVTGVAVADGFFVTGSRDGTATVWRPDGWRVLTWRFGGGVRGVWAPRGGRWVYVWVEGERGLRRWDVSALHAGLTAAGLDAGFPRPDP